MANGQRRWWRTIKTAIPILLVVVAGAALVGWYRFFREVPQAPFASPDARFKYGSVGAESTQGLPYWIFIILPRMFPEHVPGPGGYRAFGVNWEEGEELPIGFTKKTVGFPRVANNCAVCHTASFRKTPEDTPIYFPAGGSHTSNIQALLRFFARCASDPRFNPDDVMAQIDLVTRLDLLDRLAYRFFVIPRVKEELLRRQGQFAWMDRPGWPHWGPGRDDPMNLTKYFMTNLPVDDTVGNADFPAIWNLKVRDGKALQWDGSTPLTLAVLTDSALGLGAQPSAWFRDEMKWLEGYLRALPPPRYPFSVDSTLAGAGKVVFDRSCAGCHAPGPGSRLGTLIDITEIGTDRNRLESWTQAGADAANKVRTELGVNYGKMTKTNGYIAVPLDGIWLRAPYLHNGAVPTLRDLLEPVDRRPPVFYRGYDVYDPRNVGFVSSVSSEGGRAFFRFDTSERGNGNHGHVYGTDLAPAAKESLLEYLKTL
ncbi:MAG: hypothetical protein L0027_07530 [Candidatus Rokubacteria bacterium]|nr:hypothetical protein [Candidatus Rokubacteria bacterium]